MSDSFRGRFRQQAVGERTCPHFSKGSYDVAIVGAGPAGTFAAKCLAEKGLSVCCIEKRQEIGAPKRCAEGLAIDYFEKLGIKPDRKFVAQKITGLIMNSPNGTKLKLKKGIETYGGYVLERKAFDKELAIMAARAGADVQAKTRCTGLLMDGKKVIGVKAESFGERFDINAKIVVGADGVDSKVARWAGLPSLQKMDGYEAGVQFEMANVELEDPDCLEFFVGTKIAPHGYLWVFPKGKDVANVGLGMAPVEGKRPLEYLRAWVQSQPRFRDGSVVEVNAGGIPVGGPLKTFVTDNFMTVGDAAHQVNPLHGGGIGLAMCSAKILAGVAAEAIKERNTSAKRLGEYDRLWQKEFGPWLSRILKLKNVANRLNDEQLDKVISLLSPEDILKLSNGKTKEVAAIVLKKAPALGRILLSALV